MLDMRVLIAGGGTGGHLYPGIAVAQRLMRRGDCEVLFVGSRRGGERRMLEPFGFAYRGISARALPRRISADLLRAMVSYAVGFVSSLVLCLRFRPDVVVGTGAYASAPVVLAGKFFVGLASCSSRIRSPAGPIGSWPASPTRSTSPSPSPDATSSARIISN